MAIDDVMIVATRVYTEQAVIALAVEVIPIGSEQDI